MPYSTCVRKGGVEVEREPAKELFVNDEQQCRAGDSDAEDSDQPISADNLREYCIAAAKNPKLTRMHNGGSCFRIPVPFSSVPLISS